MKKVLLLLALLSAFVVTGPGPATADQLPV
jgi:hypothetical protein